MAISLKNFKLKIQKTFLSTFENFERNLYFSLGSSFKNSQKIRNFFNQIWFLAKSYFIQKTRKSFKKIFPYFSRLHTQKIFFVKNNFQNLKWRIFSENQICDKIQWWEKLAFSRPVAVFGQTWPLFSAYREIFLNGKTFINFFSPKISRK